MLKIKTIEVGQMAANCYVVFDEDDNAVIIDPGDDANTISEYILSNQLTPQAIIATHGHFDHVLAALELKLAFNIPFYIHEKDEFLLQRMQETTLHYQGFDPGPSPKPDFYLKQNAEISFSDSLVFNIIDTPGHTPGSVALLNESSGDIFVGDLLFADGSVGRTDFSYADENQLKKSVQKILQLPHDTNVHCGHGAQATVHQLREIHL